MSATSLNSSWVIAPDSTSATSASTCFFGAPRRTTRRCPACPRSAGRARSRRAPCPSPPSPIRRRHARPRVAQRTGDAEPVVRQLDARLARQANHAAVRRATLARHAVAGRERLLGPRLIRHGRVGLRVERRVRVARDLAHERRGSLVRLRAVGRVDTRTLMVQYVLQLLHIDRITSSAAYAPVAVPRPCGLSVIGSSFSM